MNAQLAHNVGEDFGTLEITLTENDDSALLWENGTAKIRLPLYSYEAREIIAALQPVAQENDQ